MRLTIRRPYGKSLKQYASVLNKYDLRIVLDEDGNEFSRSVEIKTLEDLKRLSSELKCGFVMFGGDEDILIYDDYIE